MIIDLYKNKVYTYNYIGDTDELEVLTVDEAIARGVVPQEKIDAMVEACNRDEFDDVEVQ